jgi:hypothetical protein
LLAQEVLMPQEVHHHLMLLVLLRQVELLMEQEGHLLEMAEVTEVTQVVFPEARGVFLRAVGARVAMLVMAEKVEGQQEQAETQQRVLAGAVVVQIELPTPPVQLLVVGVVLGC